MFSFYDILFYSTNIAKYERHLMVFSILRDNNLFANKKECVIGHSRIQYLRHWISSEGVKANGEKVKVMVNSSQPNKSSALNRSLSSFSPLFDL